MWLCKSKGFHNFFLGVAVISRPFQLMQHAAVNRLLMSYVGNHKYGETCTLHQSILNSVEETLNTNESDSLAGHKFKVLSGQAHSA